MSPGRPQHPRDARATPKRLVLKIASDPANLREVRHELEDFCSAMGLGQQASEDVGLCVNEALANVIRHAYHGATDRPIRIEAEEIAGGVRIRVRDWGERFDPCWQPPKPYDPASPGGVGLLCLGRLLNEITFQPQDQGTLLTMVKRRVQVQAESE